MLSNENLHFAYQQSYPAFQGFRQTTGAMQPMMLGINVLLDNNRSVDNRRLCNEVDVAHKHSHVANGQKGLSNNEPAAILGSSIMTSPLRRGSSKQR